MKRPVTLAQYLGQPGPWGPYKTALWSTVAIAVCVLLASVAP